MKNTICVYELSFQLYSSCHNETIYICRHMCCKNHIVSSLIESTKWKEYATQEILTRSKATLMALVANFIQNVSFVFFQNSIPNQQFHSDFICL